MMASYYLLLNNVIRVTVVRLSLVEPLQWTYKIKNRFLSMISVLVPAFPRDTCG